MYEHMSFTITTTTIINIIFTINNIIIVIINNVSFQEMVLGTKVVLEEVLSELPPENTIATG